MAALAGLQLLAQARHAGMAWDESVSGDLYGTGLRPKALVLQPGSNRLLGSTGRVHATDRGDFSIVVGAGRRLSAVNLLPGSSPVGLSSIGLQAGPPLTAPTTAASRPSLGHPAQAAPPWAGLKLAASAPK